MKLGVMILLSLGLDYSHFDDIIQHHIPTSAVIISIHICHTYCLLACLYMGPDGGSALPVYKN